MNRNEIITAMSKQSGLSKSVSETALDAFTEVVINALTNNEKVSLVGFGIFEAKERLGHEVVNPRTKEKMMIDSYKTPTFRAGIPFKKRVNGEG